MAESSYASAAAQELLAVLSRVEHQTAQLCETVPRGALVEARDRARAILSARATVADGPGTARLTFATELLTVLAGRLSTDARELEHTVNRIIAVSAVPAPALGVPVMRAVALERPAGAQQIQLVLLRAFSGSQSASLWRGVDGGKVVCVAAAGDTSQREGSVRRLARSLLNGGTRASRGSDGLSGAVIARGLRHASALIVCAPEEGCGAVGPLLDVAVDAIGSALEREELRQASEGRTDASVSLQRRLSRMRFDLHDGPQQDVLLLADDLRLFQSQLAHVVAEDHPDRDRLLGRVEDLQARLVALDGDLRRISSSLQSPFLQPGSLPDAVAQVADAFTERTAIDVELIVDGDMANLTDSQHITLLGLIREALSNVREHSHATRVKVELRASEHGVRAAVTDNGRGFDPESSLVQAAREGHLGLVGMHERVRMLGGNTDIDSRPGGPTIISVMLPAAPAGAPRRAD